MPFLEALPISGISISVIAELRRETTICVSDDLAGVIDELQFSLGEGPHWQAIRTGSPSIVSDVANDPHTQWPMFGEAVNNLGVGALFSFPLTLGVAVVGVADMYRGTAGIFSPDDLDTAARLSLAASAPAVQRATQSADRDSRMPGAAPELRREVQQATGMILVQLDITATEALSRLKAHSYSTGRPIDKVARDVVSRRLDFRYLE